MSRTPLCITDEQRKIRRAKQKLASKAKKKAEDPDWTRMKSAAQRWLHRHVKAFPLYQNDLAKRKAARNKAKEVLAQVRQKAQRKEDKKWVWRKFIRA